MKRFLLGEQMIYANLQPGNMLALCMECNNKIEAAVFMKVVSVTQPKNSFFTGWKRGNIRVQFPNQTQATLFKDYPKVDEFSWEIEKYIESVPGLAIRMNRQRREELKGSDHYSYSFPLLAFDSNDAYILKQMMEKEMKTRKEQAELSRKYTEIEAAAALRRAQYMKTQNAQAAGQIDDLFRGMNK